MMREEARAAFVRMVRDCGEDIIRMQASFVMYLNQYMVDFPEEQQLLLDAYKVGIPGKLVQHAGEDDYPRYLEKLGPRFAEASQRPDDESTWAVQTWAIALGRTEDYVLPARQSRLYPEDLLLKETPRDRMMASTAMALIVTAGGAIGAALASLLMPVALYATGFVDDLYTNGGSGGSGGVLGHYKVKSDYEFFLLFAVIAFIVGCIGGVAALGGWILGQGAEQPWASFSVACGTAFTMFLIVAFVPIIPLIIKPVMLFASVFGTVYKSAARGGNY